jgi:hypothetical protein
MQQRVALFFKNFLAALGHCVLEDLEVLGPVTVVLTCICIVLACVIVVQVAYEMVLAPNAADVASRLISLPIDPDKWA